VRSHLVLGTGERVSLRAASAHYEPFLRELYEDRRAPELEAAGWPLAERRPFLDMQFRAQQEGYGGVFADADHWIVVTGDEPVGRLLVARRSHEHRVVDLVILSACRGRGIGTSLMREVIADANRAGVPVGLTVDAWDWRVVGWYERLGFSVVTPGDAHLAMVRHVG
jgi:ribosomal protein S18 acetylase RimI-like enzyme